MGAFIAVVILLAVVLIILVNCIKIVPQAHALVVERLGGYLATWGVGLHFKIPFIRPCCKKSYLKGAGGGFPAAAGYYKR